MASSETMEVQSAKRCVPSLPYERIELILMRVPVSSLLRWRGVCRQWRLILRDPRFIAASMELQRAPRCPLLFSHRDSASKKLYPSEAILFDEAWSPSRWDVPVIEPDDFLVACCSGLACLYSERSTIKIANIATGECLHLAKPDNRMTGDHYSFYNFGFHPVTKQYKVKRFLGERELFYVDTFIVIQVYTLGDDRWRDVRSPRAQRFDCIDYFGVVNVDGAMYWLTEDKGNSWKRSVASFDLGEERFEWIQLPIADLAVVLLVILACTGSQRWVGRYVLPQLKTVITQPQGLLGSCRTGHLKTRQIKGGGTSALFSPHWLRFAFLGHISSVGIRSYCMVRIGIYIKIEHRKMLRLLNYSPRWYCNMRSFMYVKSLVRLDVYRKGAVFHKPKRQEGWKLKKWENWVLELCLLEKLWRRIYELEHSTSAGARRMGMNINPLLQHPPEKNRFNWVEQKRVRGILN